MSSVACAQTGVQASVKGHPTNAGRFFLEGNGTVKLHNLKTGNQGTVIYRLPDGTYPAAGRVEIDEVFGLKGDPAVENISLRFVALLDYIQDQYGGGSQAIQMNSAYRAPQYNQQLRDQGSTVAKASTHMEGMAADIRISGVDGRQLWESLREQDCCGVGWYGGASVHVDTGPSRFWTTATSKVGTDISESNKKILLRSDFDLYHPGDTIHLKLLRVTVFPFGVKRRAEFVAIQGDKEKRLKHFDLNFAGRKDDACVMIQTRQQASALSWKLPKKLKPENPTYIKVFFCQKPSDEMPDDLLSNRIAID